MASCAATVNEFGYLATGEPLPLTGKALLRPALHVALLDREGQRLAVARGLVDSGADSTTLPTEWAERLGIDVREECKPEEATVADGRASLRHVYDEGLTIEVAGEQLRLDLVRFCDNAPFVYLGRRDFFYRHAVLFDQRNFRFFLERLPDPDEDDDDPELDVALALN